MEHTNVYDDIINGYYTVDAEVKGDGWVRRNIKNSSSSEGFEIIWAWHMFWFADSVDGESCDEGEMRPLLRYHACDVITLNPAIMNRCINSLL